MRSLTRTRMTLLGMLLLLSLAIPACGGSASGGVSCDPCYHGQIRDAILSEPDSLIPELSSNAYAGQIQQAIWAPLYYTNDQAQLIPALAREVPSPENGGLSEDAKTITIRLRPNLKWSDGSPLTADDVAFTLTLFKNSPNDTVNSFQGSEIASITETDTTTVTIVLDQADATFLGFSLTNSPIFAPLPKHMYGGMTTLRSLRQSSENFKPTVSSGPFVVANRVQDSSIAVSRNPNYFGAPKPYLDSITFLVFQDSATLLLALRDGQIDTASGLSADQLAGLQSLSGYKLMPSGSSNAFEALWLNQNSPVLQDAMVREALAISIDPHVEIQQLWHGTAWPTCDDSVGTFAHEPALISSAGLCAYGKDHKTYDPNAAAQILDGDGWILGGDHLRHKNGQTLSLRLAINAQYNADHRYRAESEQIIQSAWTQLGIQVITQQFSTSAALDNALYPRALPSSPAYDVAELEGFVAVDPDSRYLWDSNQTPPQGGSNLTFYSNPQVDAWEQQQAMTPNPAERLPFFHLIHTQLLNDIPLIYLYAVPDLCEVCANLHNYSPSGVYGSSETWNVQNWWYPTGVSAPAGSADILRFPSIPIYASCRG